MLNRAMAATTLGKVLESLVHPRYADKAYSVGDTGLAAASNYFGRHGWDDFDRAPVLADFLEERGSPHADIVRKLYQPGDLLPDDYRQLWSDEYAAGRQAGNIGEIEQFPRFGAPESAPFDPYGAEVAFWNLKPQDPRLPSYDTVSSAAFADMPTLIPGHEIGDKVARTINNYVPDDYLQWVRSESPQYMSDAEISERAIRSLDPKNLVSHMRSRWLHERDNPIARVPLSYVSFHQPVVID